MKKTLKHIGLCAALLVSASATAQTVSINFETNNYKALGVYDTWGESPFRTGALQGNVAIVDNHLADPDTNPSAKMLGVQRSRFGSNTFGARIDLTEPFTIVANEKYYAHVMIHKPVEGRVMLIGLGKRGDREGQSAEVEQFWAYPINDAKTGEWFDAVFPIKCNAGVEIHTLVVVPHCEAPHTLTSDFVAYIDDVEVNDRVEARFGIGDYPVNFASDAAWQRSDRKITAVNLTSGDGEQSVTIPGEELKAYNQRFEKTLKAKPGSRISVSFGYSGNWMHGYVYLDKGRDGKFSYGTDDDNNLDMTTDLVSFSLYSKDGTNGKNSAGESFTKDNAGFNTMRMPDFTLPADMTPGMYRLRYKVDWNNIEPGGSIADNNHILSNGGGVVDVLLNVHGDEITVNQDNRNGDVLIAETGEPLQGYKHAFGQPLKIKMNPSTGFTYNGIRLRHGYNLNADSLVKSTPQFRDEYFYINNFNREDDTFTIPGEVLDGDVLIEGLFVENGTGMKEKNVTYNIEANGRTIDRQSFRVMSGMAYPKLEITSEASEAYYSITGMPEGVTTEEDEVITITIEQNLPFEPSVDFNNASWYNLSISKDKNYLTHSTANNYISLAGSTTAVPSADDYSSQWAFVGNVVEGFKLVNRAAGAGMVLSSNHDTSASTGGATFPVMTNVPVPSTHNTYWIPTVSTNISGENGFYLHQMGYRSNRMNKRDAKLAYWTGGADAGSTFLATFVGKTTGIDFLLRDNVPAEYFNMQGIRVPASALTPGAYILRQGNKVSKVILK